MPRILFVDIDTLRPDHMGCYGYGRNTTANIDRVAADSMVFDNYYCSDAPCLPSRASLIYGQPGILTGIVGHGGTAADRPLAGANRDFTDGTERENFHYLLRKAGLHTASISSFPERHSAWWYNSGLNEIHNCGGQGMESGEAVVPLALDWLERNKGKDNWYLHLHLWDPHTPYRAPQSFGDPFKDVPMHNNWISEEVYNKQKKLPGPHRPMDLSGHGDWENPKFPRALGSLKEYKDVKRMFDGYDTGIFYADHLLGQVFDLLRNQGIYDDVAIIITSDHGESMGELGLYGEHGLADNSTCRIPMIIKWPGAAKGRETGLRYSYDLLPTLAQLLNQPVAENWSGQSYAGNITGKSANPGRESLVISQQTHVCQRSARFGDWLYIRTIRDGFQLFDDEMLFNIKDDPYEQHDVKAQHPDICAKGAKIILDWQEENMKRSHTGVDPMWTVVNEGGPYHANIRDLPNYLKRLENSGRADSAAELRKRYGLKDE